MGELILFVIKKFVKELNMNMKMLFRVHHFHPLTVQKQPLRSKGWQKKDEKPQLVSPSYRVWSNIPLAVWQKEDNFTPDSTRITRLTGFGILVRKQLDSTIYAKKDIAVVHNVDFILVRRDIRKGKRKMMYNGFFYILDGDLLNSALLV